MGRVDLLSVFAAVDVGETVAPHTTQESAPISYHKKKPRWGSQHPRSIRRIPCPKRTSLRWRRRNSKRVPCPSFSTPSKTGDRSWSAAVTTRSSSGECAALTGIVTWYWRMSKNYGLKPPVPQRERRETL